MSLTRVARTTTLNVKVSPTTANSGDPVVVNASVGGIKGVCLADADASGFAVIELAHESMIQRLSVLASTDDGLTSPLGGGSAVLLGEALYINPTTGVISKDSTGNMLFGYALGTKADGIYKGAATLIAAAATAAIDVLLA